MFSEMSKVISLFSSFFISRFLEIPVETCLMDIMFNLKTCQILSSTSRIVRKNRNDVRRPISFCVHVMFLSQVTSAINTCYLLLVTSALGYLSFIIPHLVYSV